MLTRLFVIARLSKIPPITCRHVLGLPQAASHPEDGLVVVPQHPILLRQIGCAGMASDTLICAVDGEHHKSEFTAVVAAENTQVLLGFCLGSCLKALHCLNGFAPAS